MSFGKRPDTQFVEKTVLDGTEHHYSQEGGVSVYFTLETAKDWILAQSSFDLFDLLNTEATLPTGGSINPDKVYIVRNYNSTGKAASLVYDSSLPGWRSISQTDNPYVVVSNMAGLPPSGNVDKLYHCIDGGNGQARLLRWDGSSYVDLDQDNNIYQLSNIAARNALSGMRTGNVCIMTDSDGSGNRGVSWYTGSAWTTPIIQYSATLLPLPVLIVTGSATITTSNRIIIAYSSSGSVVLTLPAANTSTGIPFIIKAGNLTNPISITTVSGLIDLAGSKSFSNALESFTIVSDGTNYFIV